MEIFNWLFFKPVDQLILLLRYYPFMATRNRSVKELHQLINTQRFLNVKHLTMCLLFVWGFRPTREFITHMEKSTLMVKGCKFWPMPLSSGGSSTWHTHCDTGHPFIMVISEDPWQSHLSRSVLQWSCHYLFLQLRYVARICVKMLKYICM